MLDSSVFQGVLVMSDTNLKRVAPESSGDRYFLIELPDPGAADSATSALETALRSYGLDTERVSRRLADFLAVQNTYLSTFQMLGGLGAAGGHVWPCGRDASKCDRTACGNRTAAFTGLPGVSHRVADSRRKLDASVLGNCDRNRIGADRHAAAFAQHWS